ncbi:hypothetical protein [Halocatena pleomorpha]|uniref:Uncharacterized protein n=1 Tax=Halocatena pleomorpha TaxID=1785090 RepID=A0A3P3RJ23_9EURY|nr:hypothetical protein [Halocatena pleomorpha]RRJ33526.1 hypothetical protein EIK79_01615 [Halocatena pleomorpha]
MHRRRFLRVIGATALPVLAGCSSDETPPPRKSSVVEQLETNDGMIRIDLADRVWVLSRYTPPRSSIDAPVGVAAAKGGGGGSVRGATGRAGGGHVNAPRTNHGWAWWHGGDYADDWYDDHEDETSRYSVRIEKVGVRSFGSDAVFKKDRPGAGPVDWDWTYRSPKDRIDHPLRKPGWYRVGAHIVGKKVDHDFQWECVDFKVSSVGQSYAIQNEWKVSPRI